MKTIQLLQMAGMGLAVLILAANGEGVGARTGPATQSDTSREATTQSATTQAAITQPATTQPATTQPARGEGTADLAHPNVVYVLPDQIVNGRRYVGGFTSTNPVAAEDVAEDYSCVIRLDGKDDQIVSRVFNGYANSYSSSVDTGLAVSLLTSTAVMDPAASKTLKFAPDQRRDLVTVAGVPINNHLVRLEITLKKSAAAHYAPDAAQRFGAALVENLKAAFEQSGELSRKAAAANLEPEEKRLADSKARLAKLQAKERELRGQLTTFNGNSLIDINFSLTNLRNQKKNTESELARNKARLAELDPKNGPASQGWADLVKLRQGRVAELKKAPGDHAAEINEEELKLAEANAQLGLMRQQEAATNGTNQHFQMVEANNLRTAVSDEEDRLKQYNEQLAKLEDPKFAAELAELPDMSTEEQNLRNSIANMANRVEQLKAAQEADGPVTVTVIDGQGH